MPLRTYQHITDRDPLSQTVTERMLAGVPRAATGAPRPVGEELERAARSASESAVSRTFAEPTRKAPGELT